MTNQRSNDVTYAFTTPGIQTFDFERFKKETENEYKYEYNYVTLGDE